MSSSDDKIKKAFSEKTWNEIKTSDSWQIFKVMAEFVEGFEKLGSIGPCVSIFGSARTKEENEYYVLAEDIAYKLTQSGYGVITRYIIKSIRGLGANRLAIYNNI